jgi:magnesium-protoporphyrin O-methyltransferase
MPCCFFDESVDEQFTAAKARDELRDYRARGPAPTTRMLLDGLAQAGLIEGTILDIGAGVGALSFEALDRGCRRALIVDASSAYLKAAADEAGRRGRSGDVDFARGDFVDVATSLPSATLVTLDRVICCYPAYEQLLGEALGHAERGIALSYPKDRWYVRVFTVIENKVRQWSNRRFRTFVHPEKHIRAVIEAAGFELVGRQTSLVWSAEVYRRSRVRTY